MAPNDYRYPTNMDEQQQWDVRSSQYPSGQRTSQNKSSSAPLNLPIRTQGPYQPQGPAQVGVSLNVNGQQQTYTIAREDYHAQDQDVREAGAHFEINQASRGSMMPLPTPLRVTPQDGEVYHQHPSTPRNLPGTSEQTNPQYNTVTLQRYLAEGPRDQPPVLFDKNVIQSAKHQNDPKTNSRGL